MAKWHNSGIIIPLTGFLVLFAQYRLVLKIDSIQAKFAQLFNTTIFFDLVCWPTLNDG